MLRACRLRALAVIAAGLATLAGCASGGDAAPSTPVDGSAPATDGGRTDAGLDALFPGCDPAIDTCPPSQYCSAITKTCLEGCRLDTGCPTAKPRCDVLSHKCVDCLTSDQCPTGMACSDHLCVPACSTTRPCDAGGTCCSGACVDVKFSAENCGACGTKCSVASGTPRCAAGVCSISDCSAGFADCDKKYENGCEIVLDNDTKNCGKCATVCGTTNGTATCTAGACGLTCATSFGNCNGKLDDGCEVDLRGDPKNCGKCGASPAEVCNGLDDDCDGEIDQIFGCIKGTPVESCPTTCGTTGTMTCSDTCAISGCVPPGEACNVADDDCNGACDDLDGCRKGIHRSVASATGEHFYTDSSTEAACCGFAVETFDFYYLYTAAQPGLAPFYRCFGGSPGRHFYTTDPACEGLGAVEGAMGFIATAPTCGAIPLYRVYRAASHDHFYTTSAAERASTFSGGYVDQGIAGYVWGGPRG